MKNPYSETRFKKLKRNSKLRYGKAVILAFPAYLLWQFSRLIPEQIGWRLRKRFSFLFLPFQYLKDFFMFWLTTRAWRHLLYAVPLIVVLAWIFSTMFLANSMSDEELYKTYRKTLMNSVQGGDFKKADFMTGKLMAVNAYQGDENTLYAAMIAAHEAGNVPRSEVLRKRLTSELNSPRAHMWSASRYMTAQAKAQGLVPKAIEHMQKAIELSDDAEAVKRMKMQLMNVYYQEGRHLQAIQILDELGVADYRMGVLRGSLFLAKGEKDKANKAVMETLRSLDAEGASKDDHLKVRLDALTILSDAGGEVKFIKDQLAELISLLENMLVLNPEDEKLKPLLVQSYMVLGRLVFQDQNIANKRKALVYFDKAIAAGDVVPPRLGALFLYASNLESTGGLTEPQIRESLIRGEGVAAGHLLLGIDAWKRDRMDKADFHFQMAHAHEPRSLRVLEYVALNMAKRSDSLASGTFIMSLQSEPLWRRALKLLQRNAKLDNEPLGDNLKFQCLILAEREHWHEIEGILEPHINEISGIKRMEFLKILIRASNESGNVNKARKYTQILRTEMEDLEL